MKLQEYLKKEKHTQQSFIDLVEMAKGVKIPQSTFAKWVLDIRIPRKKEMIFSLPPPLLTKRIYTIYNK